MEKSSKLDKKAHCKQEYRAMVDVEEEMGFTHLFVDEIRLVMSQGRERGKREMEKLRAR